MSNRSAGDRVDHPRLRFGVTPWLSSTHAGETVEQRESQGMPLVATKRLARAADEEVDGALLASQAEQAEALGLDSFWLPESHFFSRAVPSPLIQLAFVAGVTRSISLGTTSLLLPIRNPVLLAEEIATLDQLSGGRLILGIGRGFRKELFEVLDVDAGQKRDLLEASVERMRAAWRGESLGRGARVEERPGGVVDDHSSDLDSERGLSPKLFPRPRQQPHPPLWMAAFGPKALEQAARFEMPYLASPLESRAVLEHNYETLARCCAAVGHQPPRRRPIMRVVAICDDPRDLARMRQSLEGEQRSWLQTAAPALRSSLSAPLEERVLIGTRSQVYDQIQNLVSGLGLTDLIARCAVPSYSELAQNSVEELARLARDFGQ